MRDDLKKLPKSTSSFLDENRNQKTKKSQGDRLKAYPTLDEKLIEKVVRDFYTRIKGDPLLGSIFNQTINDWEPHLQTMFSFWSAVMLHSGTYKGKPMPKHVILPIDAHHFDRWLELFDETVNGLCSPEVAALFRTRAAAIAKSLEMGVAFHNGASIKLGERYIRTD